MSETIRFDPPDWAPLEAALPERWLDGWMFMAYLRHPDRGEWLRAYKHQITRRYLHLRIVDGVLEAWRYAGDSTYRPAKLVEEVDLVYARIERCGWTREMEALTHWDVPEDGMPA